MSPPARVGESLVSRVLIELMRAVPAVFTIGWLAPAVVWLMQGRIERALAALAVAAIAASFGADRALRSPLAKRRAFRVSKGSRKICRVPS
jgi:hypothetical protein